MVVAGSDDRIVPYSGGPVASFAGKKRGFVAPVDAFFSFWAARNGCRPAAVTTTSSRLNEARGADCREPTAVVRYRVIGGGHEWFASPTFDATTKTWEFLAPRL
jgi:poly(3-hydroxybutyrate) depolymerase